MKKEVILASKSPRRQEILQMLGLSFRVQVSGAEEIAPDGLTPAQLVEFLAGQKLDAVRAAVPEDAVIITADTVVCCDDRILGKPADPDEAAAMLKLLSGRAHSVFTGIAVSNGDKIAAEAVETRVHFRELSPEEIDYYISHANVCDKAGAYAIQEFAGTFVEKLEGDYHSVVGLSVCALDRLLKAVGCPLLDLLEDCHA